MSNLINDGSLIGLWPLHEASGAYSWKNYSPARANHPSGITFDMLGHTTAPTINDQELASVWPGQEIIDHPFSGVQIKGLKLQGRAQQPGVNKSAPFSKVLVMGNGTFVQRSETLGPAIANSGFTVGLWVFPMSDGWINAESEGGFSSVLETWFVGHGRVHSLMAQSNNDVGWFIGVSGSLSAATPVGANKFGGLPQLRAYALIDVASGPTPEIDIPIESGRYTHMTMTYRYVDGISNEVAFYKDGHLEASGVTNRDIVFDTSPTIGPDSVTMTIGGTTDNSVSADSYESSSGWGHLVSGAYCFRRVLHEGEILEMHQRGGLQPDIGLRDNLVAVNINDSHLLAHVDGKGPGWIDSSKNHNNFITKTDAGDRSTFYTHSPGPFNINGAFHDGGTNKQLSIVAPSGATFDAVTSDGGFTICGFFQPQGIANDRDGSIMISMGSVSAATFGAATPATVSSNTLGIMLSYNAVTGFGDRISLEVFPIGDGTTDNITLRIIGEQIFKSTNVHYGIIYDATTKGIALYLDGYEAASGTLAHDLRGHLTNLAGSGFPIMFANGISNTITDNAAKGSLANGGQNMSSGPYSIFSRPLGIGEMRFMAQSGIDTSPLWKTRYDTRLMGYWPCDTFDLGDIIIDDVARSMSPATGPLTRGHSDTKWERVYNRNNSRPDNEIFNNNGTASVDLFTGEQRTPDSFQQTFGNLGITSGTFMPHGGSQFGGGISNNLDSRNTPFNAVTRYTPWNEERDLAPQNLNEYIISFEVTPSGNIPQIDATSHALSTNQHWFNSKLHVHGNLGNSTVDGEVTSFLTTQNSISPDPLGFDEGLGGSGVTICFVGRDGSSTTTITPIMSGILKFGIPNKVLLHAKFEEPYQVLGATTGNSPMTVSLWIDGQLVNTRTDNCTNWRLWSDQIPDSLNSDWLLQFGGYASTDTTINNILEDSGLGEIYMREIFIMRGIFEKDEVRSLAVSGIQNPIIAGYSPQLPTTQVTISDTTLEGYWRFNGFDGNVGQVSNSPGGSGTTDLSNKNNHLDAIAQRVFEEGTSVDLAETMRALPGPHKNSTLGVQCSGFHNASIEPANVIPNMMPPFAVSGIAFDNPAGGFSVGFLMAKRDDIPFSNGFDCLLCYGVATNAPPNGSVLDSSLDPNRGWLIGMDDVENIKMVLSTGGNMYIDGTSSTSNSGQIVCGTTLSNNVLSDVRSWNRTRQGDFSTPSVDYWNHYCWTYDPSISGGSGVRCYLNGQLVDERFIPSDRINPWTGTTVAPQTPVEPTTRMITFRSHQAAAQTPAAWDFRQNILVDVDSVMTDVFYFSRALSESEIRYVAQHGIDAATGVPASGIIGGFMHGQDTGSGIAGGFSRGQDTGSGIIGGFIPAGFEGSGIFGGYVSGIVFGNGTIGGWIQGIDNVSGIMAGYIVGVNVGSGSIAGYIHGQDVGSGHFGGLIFASENTSGVFGGFINVSDVGSGIVGGFALGGLQQNLEFDAGFTISVLSAKDFDAQLEIAKTVSSDFDAKVIIFQDETPPIVDIIIPDVSISGLVPPFNQYFIAKASGQQGKTITSTRWTFGDLTPSESIATSGAGCYPVQHMYASSGFFIAKFEAIDSNGLHSSATRIINAASGIDPVLIGLSGVPRSGNSELIVDFSTTIDILPDGVSVSTQLLSFDDGQTTIAFSPTHVYTQPGTYKPIWIVRDSRGIIWCDSLQSGNDFLESGGA